jgi:hypothetical protein
MTIEDKLNGSELPVNEPLLSGHNGIAADAPAGIGFGLMRSRWMLLAVRRRRLLFYSGLGALLLAFILTEFVMHKKYRAEAIIRPVTPDQSGIGGLLQSTGLLPGNSSMGNGISGPPDPNEVVAILQSYAFTTAMVTQEHLAPKLMKGSRSLGSLIFSSKPKPPSEYSLYSLFRLMTARFDCNLSVRTGNMSLTFIDKDPELARTILGLYITRLRDQIRFQTVRDTSAALDSLLQEVSKTPDPTLRDSIYQLVAQQMQQVKTAQANADFAFVVVEPPFVPPYPVAPWPIFDSLAAGILVSLMVFAGLVVADSVPRLRQELASAIAATERARKEEIIPIKSRRPAPLTQTVEERPHPL